MKEIQSVKNPLIKELRKLHKKKYREETGCYLLEGFHLVEEARESGAQFREVLITKRGLNEWGSWLSQQVEEAICYHVSDEVMSAVSDLPTPQGILAVIEKTEATITEYRGGWLLLDNVQDPGNVGTMIRTADAFGLTGVILGEGTADLYSTKVLRSMQGSNYHLSVFQNDLLETLAIFKKQQIPVYGTELNEEAVALNELPKIANYALVVGNEGQGVQKEILKQTDKNIYIPIPGKAESLNVGVAAGIIMHHFSIN